MPSGSVGGGGGCVGGNSAYAGGSSDYGGSGDSRASGGSGGGGQPGQTERGEVPPTDIVGLFLIIISIFFTSVYLCQFLILGHEI